MCGFSSFSVLQFFNSQLFASVLKTFSWRIFDSDPLAMTCLHHRRHHPLCFAFISTSSAHNYCVTVWVFCITGWRAGWLAGHHQTKILLEKSIKRIRGSQRLKIIKENPLCLASCGRQVKNDYRERKTERST